MTTLLFSGKKGKQYSGREQEKTRCDKKKQDKKQERTRLHTGQESRTTQGAGKNKTRYRTFLSILKQDKTKTR